MVNRPNLAKSADGLVAARECENVDHGFPECSIVAAMREELRTARANEARISELHANAQREIDEDNFEIASLLERAEKAEAALAQTQQDAERWRSSMRDLIAGLSALCKRPDFLAKFDDAARGEE